MSAILRLSQEVVVSISAVESQGPWSCCRGKELGRELAPSWFDIAVAALA
jgi:hypothetical protein